jgi:hypothetical protein
MESLQPLRIFFPLPLPFLLHLILRTPHRNKQARTKMKPTKRTKPTRDTRMGPSHLELEVLVGLADVIRPLDPLLQHRLHVKDGGLVVRLDPVPLLQRVHPELEGRLVPGGGEGKREREKACECE